MWNARAAEVLAAMAAAAWIGAGGFGCGGRGGVAPGDGGDGSPGGSGGGSGGASDGPVTSDVGLDAGPGSVSITFPAADVNPEAIDILFMIDNSPSMLPLQQKLLNNFPVLMQTLEAVPKRPSLHIGVVSSSLGAGQFTTIPGCPMGGDQGKLQNQPRGTCTSSGLDPGAFFISSDNGVTNFDPSTTIEDVFSCIALLGDQGCGFEHQLASVARALGADGAPPPAENAGFLRPEALLSIVLVTNEDDCSAPPTSPIFDPSSRFVSDPYGPLASYRCNEYGHLCNGQRPPRTMAASFPPGACHSAEDGVLLRVADVAARLKALKPDPNRIVVQAITGPNDPYVVQLTPPQLATDPSPWPSIAHSCQQSSGEFADPAIRLFDLVTAFGSHGVFLPICATSFGPAFQVIAESTGDPASGCLPSPPLDLDPGQPGIQPACTAYIDDPASPGRVSVPPCPSVGTSPLCFVAAPNTRCGASGVSVSVEAPGTKVPAGASVVVTCQAGGSP
jgi:hypothetical protein